MKWLLIATCLLSAFLLIAGGLVFIYPDRTKPYIDLYANHAGVFGFFVSVFGFILTVWAVFETLKVTTKAQEETAAAVTAARKETKDLLERIRIKMMGDTCDQAYFLASEARKAIRVGNWQVAIERSHDARQLASRLMSFQDITEAERVSIRAVIEDLKTSIAFMERNRLKPEAPAGLPDDKIRALDSLMDELDKVRSRLQQQLLEVFYVDINGPAS